MNEIVVKLQPLLLAWHVRRLYPAHTPVLNCAMWYITCLRDSTVQQVSIVSYHPSLSSRQASRSVAASQGWESQTVERISNMAYCELSSDAEIIKTGALINRNMQPLILATQVKVRCMHANKICVQDVDIQLIINQHFRNWHFKIFKPSCLVLWIIAENLENPTSFGNYSQDKKDKTF